MWGFSIGRTVGLDPYLRRNTRRDPRHGSYRHLDLALPNPSYWRTGRRFRTHPKTAEVVGQFISIPTRSSAARLASRLASNLALLKAEEHGTPTPQRLAFLVEEVTTAERALKWNARAACEETSLPEEIGHEHRTEIETALKVLIQPSPASEEILAGLPDTDDSIALVANLRVTIQRPNEPSVEISTATQTTALSQSNLLGLLVRSK